MDEERRKTGAAERQMRSSRAECDDLDDQLETCKTNLLLCQVRNGFAAVSSETYRFLNQDSKAALENEVRSLRAQLSSEQEHSLQAELRTKKADSAQAELLTLLSQMEERKNNEIRARKEAQKEIKELQDQLAEADAVTLQFERSKRMLQEEIQNVKEDVSRSLLFSRLWSLVIRIA